MAKIRTAAAGRVDNLFAQAVQHHQAGRLGEAETLYRSILTIDPSHADSLHLLGLIAREAGHSDAAAQLIGEAARIAPGNAMFHNNLGAVLQEQGKAGEAVASVGRALALEPDYAEAHNHLGNALRDQGKLDEAAASYEKALAFMPNLAQAHNNLGIVRKEQGRLTDAVACYGRAIALKPNYADAHNNLGNALAELGAAQDAAASYERALRLRPNYPDAYNNLGAVLQEQRKWADARDCYERALAQRPGFIDAHINLGTVLLEQGERDAALAQAEIAKKIGPPAGTLEFALGDLLLKCEVKDGAETYLRRYLEYDPGDRKGARLLLAGMGAEPLPERASGAFLDRLYAHRAAFWDLTASHDEPYRGATLVADAVLRATEATAKLDILDAGCGTGLAGPLLRDRAGRLDGIDVSAAMLDKARGKQIYDALHQGDMVAFMSSHPQAYDVVASAATLIHFGDLKPVFEATAATLRDDGLFVFTLFPNDSEHEGPEVIVAKRSLLAYGGCYAHGPDYVAKLATATGFAVDSLTRDTHEHHGGEPIQGLVVVLQRGKR